MILSISNIEICERYCFPIIALASANAVVGCLYRLLILLIVFYFSFCWLLPHDTMPVKYILSPCACLSVFLSLARIVP